MEEVSRKVKELVEVYGFFFDRVIYYILIKGYLKVGDLNGVFEMMCEMGQKGIKMNIIIFNIIFDVLCKERKFDEVRSLLDSVCK